MRPVWKIRGIHAHGFVIGRKPIEDLALLLRENRRRRGPPSAIRSPNANWHVYACSDIRIHLRLRQWNHRLQAANDTCPNGHSIPCLSPPVSVHYPARISIGAGRDVALQHSREITEMTHSSTRRDFLRTTAVAGAGLLVAWPSFAASKKKVLLFTKSSGFEHAAIKEENGKPSIMEAALRNFADPNNFELTARKMGGSSTRRNSTTTPRVIFFTTGDLTDRRQRQESAR